MPAFAAVDLGATSGRVLRGDLDGGRLEVREVARFRTGAQPRDGRLRWDLPAFLCEIEAGLRAAGALGPLAGIGVDSWGVDFGLLDEGERLLELPVAYRDPRTGGVAERFFRRVPFAEVYRRTGIQLLPFNTLYQLAALAEGDPGLLRRARHLLLVPDLVHHHLAGVRATELTDASTTQLLGLDGAWDRDLVAAAGADPGLLQDLVPPGTALGPLRPAARAATGLPAVGVIAPATHDTASAVAAVPAEGGGWAYLSSGTWSLVGIETGTPLVGDAAREANLTNEAGVSGTRRVLRNVMGLWIAERLREECGVADPATFAAMAESAPPGGPIVDPDDPVFLRPPSMVEALRSACRAAGGAVPEGPAALARCAFESLARRYAEVLGLLEKVSGREIRRLHVVGGGSRNDLLNRLTADAAGIPVIAGPAEAAAMGNLLVQARAAGELSSLAEIREVVRRSVRLRTFEPRPA